MTTWKTLVSGAQDQEQDQKRRGAYLMSKHGGGSGLVLAQVPRMRAEGVRKVLFKVGFGSPSATVNLSLQLPRW